MLFIFLSGVAAGSLFTSGKYAIDPEQRGLEYERITQNLDVHFWKTFWNITESEVLAVSINFFFNFAYLYIWVKLLMDFIFFGCFLLGLGEYDLHSGEGESHTLCAT